MNNNNNSNNNNNKKKNENTRFIIICVIATLFTIMLITFLNNKIQEGSRVEITYSKFLEMIDNNEIKAVKVSSNKIYIVPKKENGSPIYTKIYYTGVMSSDLMFVDRLEKAGIEFTNEIKNPNSGMFTYIIFILGLWIVLGIVFRMMTKNGGGVMGVGKSTAKMYVQKETGVTFLDVAGQDEAKESMNEIVDFLHNPSKYTKIGAKLPKGALLVGPPGTGKTLLAKAVAGEAQVPFFSLSGSDFVEMFVGVGASRVRDLFKRATQMAPCIIFIDEIDAIGKSRDSRYGGGNDEREQTLNQLLAEMDGFDSSKGIIILGATNRPEVLDNALLRPGRFDRRIIVEKPDLKGRIDTLKVHSKDVRMDETVDLEEIALATSGAVGSDLANMINEAAIMAARNGRNTRNA